MSKCTNCIYFKEHDDDLPCYHVCKHSGTLYTVEELESGIMGKHCRLWDAYIPVTATNEQIKYAQKWQNMSYDEQPSYEEYFKE